MHTISILRTWERCRERVHKLAKSHQGFNKIILNTCNIRLQFMLLGEFLVLLNKGVDSVNHLLDELHLGVTEPVLVGDVVSDA